MRFVLAVSALALVAARSAAAADLSLPGELGQLQVHGFISQGFLYTSDNNYLANSSRGSFEFTELGLNFTLQPLDRLTLGLQIFSHDLGPIGDYRATLDWYSVDYHWQDWLGVRAGRVKLPFELYGYRGLGPAGGLDYRMYGGTIFLDIRPQPGSPVTAVDLNVPFVAGGRLMWAAPVDGLRLGGSLQFLRLETHLMMPSNPGQVAVNFPVMLWVASVEYTVRDLLFAVEYSRWRVRTESSNPALVPESLTFSERGYALASYRVNSWLQAGAYYSLLFPNVSRRGTLDGRQHDAALTLRFDVNPFWLVKVEGHYMHGMAGLSSSLNGNQPLKSLSPDWAFFAVKTTAFF